LTARHPASVVRIPRPAPGGCRALRGEGNPDRGVVDREPGGTTTSDAPCRVRPRRVTPVGSAHQDRFPRPLVKGGAFHGPKRLPSDECLTARLRGTASSRPATSVRFCHRNAGFRHVFAPRGSRVEELDPEPVPRLFTREELRAAYRSSTSATDPNPRARPRHRPNLADLAAVARRLALDDARGPLDLPDLASGRARKRDQPSCHGTGTRTRA
jgi:hypothetical protein